MLTQTMGAWMLAWLGLPPVAALAALAIMRRRERHFEVTHALRAAIVFGLAAGTVTHVVLLARRGPIFAPSLPPAVNGFWAALAVVDPAVAVAVIVRPRLGLIAASALMLADVSVNAVVSGGFADWAVVVQTAFALLVLATTVLVFRRR